MAHVNRKEYWTIFVVLFVLTVLEVGSRLLGHPQDAALHRAARPRAGQGRHAWASSSCT